MFQVQGRQRHVRFRRLTARAVNTSATCTATTGENPATMHTGPDSGAWPRPRRWDWAAPRAPAGRRRHRRASRRNVPARPARPAGWSLAPCRTAAYSSGRPVARINCPTSCSSPPRKHWSSIFASCCSGLRHAAGQHAGGPGMPRQHVERKQLAGALVDTVKKSPATAPAARTCSGPDKSTASGGLLTGWARPKNAELTSCRIFAVMPMSREMISPTRSMEGDSFRNSSASWSYSAGRVGRHLMRVASCLSCSLPSRSRSANARADGLAEFVGVARLGQILVRRADEAQHGLALGVAGKDDAHRAADGASSPR